MAHGPGSNPTTDDSLNLPGTGCCGAVSTLGFESPWRVLRAWSWKVPRLSKRGKKKKKTVNNTLPKLLFSLVFFWLDCRPFCRFEDIAIQVKSSLASYPIPTHSQSCLSSS